MLIEKVLNNNVAVIRNDRGQETVVMGRGIAFQKKTGDEIDRDRVEKVFTLDKGDENAEFQKLLADMPAEYILLSGKITDMVQTQLNRKLHDSILVALTDHIASAIERHKEGIRLKNPMLWDIRQFYPEEYRLGIEALEMIREMCGEALPEDEAAFLALHFVNAQMNESMTIVHDITKLIQEITGIVKYHFQIEYVPDSPAYYRFINHLKYFAQRLFNKEAYDGENDNRDLFDTVAGQQPDAFSCTHAIAGYVNRQYGYEMCEDEMLYMTVHIARIVKEARKRGREN